MSDAHDEGPDRPPPEPASLLAEKSAPSELASLFAEERARPEPEAEAAHERLRARLEASLAPTLLTKIAPLVVALAVGGAIGSGVTATLRTPTIVYVDRPVAAFVTAPPSAPSPPPPTEIPSAAPIAPTPPIPTPSSAYVDQLARERAILDPARAALGKGDAADALAGTERHAREFPRGQMAEEREVMAIQALTKLGRTIEATTRAADFRARYPNSVLIPVVDSVTKSLGAPN